ncbi:MAG: DUF58 domain-containing protein [Leptolyngbyaceae cyanobacterium bins.349]|nr:DUF58 domain-containing protein [Leptolyngbyaceae cyanobacterium bins.349]
MRLNRRFADWLESHWVAPSYSGWLLGALSIFFFVAATNTLAGWLYVISGIGLALLAIAAILPERTLRQLHIRRAPIHPVSAGDQLTIELIIENRSRQPKTLLQIQDDLPPPLGRSIQKSIEHIAPTAAYHWIYCYPTQRRGVYRWQHTQLRTANPLGLFWCRRVRAAKATAVVYPTVLPLTHCPLIDDMGQDASLLFNSDRRAQAATEGLTRSLRPYRWGDPTRLVHWRSSARYGELRVRELEIFTGGQELLICLDSAFSWRSLSSESTDDAFEQAVIAAASLYFYACHRNLNVKLWTAGTGLIQGNQVVLEALAATQAGETARTQSLPTAPLVWLTQNPVSLNTLPRGSRWLLWADAIAPETTPATRAPQQHPGILMQGERSLQQHLQSCPTLTGY